MDLFCVHLLNLAKLFDIGSVLFLNALIWYSNYFDPPSLLFHDHQSQLESLSMSVSPNKEAYKSLDCLDLDFELFPKEHKKLHQWVDLIRLADLLNARNLRPSIMPSKQ